MFSPLIIGVAFIGSCCLGYVLGKVIDLRNVNAKLGNVFFALCLVPPLVCLVAGIDLLAGWSDPFLDADPEVMGKAAARGRGPGRGGLIIIAIRFWPYVLIGIGGFIGWCVLSVWVRVSNTSK